MCPPSKTMNNANETNSSILGAKSMPAFVCFAGEICHKGRVDIFVMCL